MSSMMGFSGLPPTGLETDEGGLIVGPSEPQPLPLQSTRWYFGKEKLSKTPSRRAGIDPDKELTFRQQAANFIQDIGQRLQVNQLCINTAIVYMHRFYMFHSFLQFNKISISTAAIFLAAKVEEQPRKLEYVIKIAHYCLHRDTQPPVDVKSEAYLAQSAELVSHENILLQTLGFDVSVDHPHTHVVKCCQLVRASKDLAQTSYFMATNSLHLTTMCLQYPPSVVACVCIYLACKWSNWEIPRSKEGREWYFYVNESVTPHQLESLTTEFLTIFNKSPSRLKKKILSLSTATSGGCAGGAGGALTNFPTHFTVDRNSAGAQTIKSRSRSPSPTPNTPGSSKPIERSVGSVGSKAPNPTQNNLSMTGKVMKSGSAQTSHPQSSHSHPPHLKKDIPTQSHSQGKQSLPPTKSEYPIPSLLSVSQSGAASKDTQNHPHSRQSYAPRSSNGNPTHHPPQPRHGGSYVQSHGTIQRPHSAPHPPPPPRHPIIKQGLKPSSQSAPVMALHEQKIETSGSSQQVPANGSHSHQQQRQRPPYPPPPRISTSTGSSGSHATAQALSYLKGIPSTQGGISEYLKRRPVETPPPPLDTKRPRLAPPPPLFSGEKNPHVQNQPVPIVALDRDWKPAEVTGRTAELSHDSPSLAPSLPLPSVFPLSSEIGESGIESMASGFHASGDSSSQSIGDEGRVVRALSPLPPPPSAQEESVHQSRTEKKKKKEHRHKEKKKKHKKEKHRKKEGDNPLKIKIPLPPREESSSSAKKSQANTVVYY